MASYELIMPKMGESITEATILKWNKKIGDTVEVLVPRGKLRYEITSIDGD